MQSMAKSFQTPTKTNSVSCGKWDSVSLRENVSPVQLKKKTPKAKTPGRAVMHLAPRSQILAGGY